MKILIRCLWGVALCFTSQNLLAYTGQCRVVSGNPAININLGAKTITDANNIVGNSVDPLSSWSATNDYSLSCDCDGTTISSGLWAFSAASSLPASGDGWLQLNDSLDVKLSLNIRGQSPLISVPFDGIGGNSDSRADICSASGLHLSGSSPNGHNGDLGIRIRKPIIGTMTIPQTLIGELWECYNTPSSGECTMSGASTLKYYLSGTISAPEECILDNTDMINISLGSFYLGAFKIKGLPPGDPYLTGVSFTISCSSGVEATANLKLSLSGPPDPDYPMAIKTDKAGVGVMVFDANQNAIDPSGGVFPPVTLRDHKVKVMIYSEPVSTTGTPPTETGKFTANAYIRVDYD